MKNVTIIPLCCVSDLPARAALCEMKNHNGYYSCIYCNLRGVVANRSHYWPYFNIEKENKRKMDDFFINALIQDEGVKGKSVLLNISEDFDIIEFFAIDYMHQHLEGNSS